METFEQDLQLRTAIRKELAEEIARHLKDQAELLTCTCGYASEHGPRCPIGAYQSATRIAQLLAEEELPTLESIRGISPSAAGDLSSEEFVRRMRDEEW